MNDNTSAEALRLQALDSFRILDTPPEATFDDVVHLASQICGVPIALISLVDRERLYFKARTGLDVEQVARHRSLCECAISNPGALLEVGDASLDPRFADTPLVTEAPGIRFYAATSLVTPEGHAIGTLCVINRQSHALDDAQRAALLALGRVTVQLLQARRMALELQRTAADREFTGLRFARRAGDAAPPDDSGLARLSKAAQGMAGDGCAVAVIEISNFRQLREEHGQDAAEEALVQFERMAKDGLHEADLLCRHGGHEFLLLLSDAARAPQVLDRIRERIAALPPTQRPSLSAGVATGSGNADAMEDLFARADRALQQSRSAGANRIMYA
ncbi:MAG: sensor domain-containing diguanylate cyclase [Luteimonas sp.]